MLLGLLNSDGKSTRKPVAARRHLVAWMDGQWEIPGGGLDHGIWKKHGHIIYKLTGAKRREWMGCWGLLGWFTRDFAWIIPENSLRSTHRTSHGKWCFNGTIIEVNDGGFSSRHCASSKHGQRGSDLTLNLQRAKTPCTCRILPSRKLGMEVLNLTTPGFAWVRE